MIFQMGATTARGGGAVRSVVLPDHRHIDDRIDGGNQRAAKRGGEIVQIELSDPALQQIHGVHTPFHPPYTMPFLAGEPRIQQKSRIKGRVFQPVLYPAHHVPAEWLTLQASPLYQLSLPLVDPLARAWLFRPKTKTEAKQPLLRSGGDNWARTSDLLRVKQALYPAELCLQN